MGVEGAVRAELREVRPMAIRMLGSWENMSDWLETVGVVGVSTGVEPAFFRLRLLLADACAVSGEDTGSGAGLGDAGCITGLRPRRVRAGDVAKGVCALCVVSPSCPRDCRLVRGLEGA